MYFAMALGGGHVFAMALGGGPWMYFAMAFLDLVTSCTPQTQMQ